MHSEKDGLLDHIVIFAPAPAVTPSPVETMTEVPPETMTLGVATEAPPTGTQVPLPGLIALAAIGISGALIAMRRR